VTIDLETLALIQKAVLKNQTLESTGLELTPQVVEAFNSLVREYEDATKGSMAEVVEDLEWGKWDSFIRANEKAHGPLFGDKPLDEQLAERKAEHLRRTSKDS
jgi:hypothetical protein